MSKSKHILILPSWYPPDGGYFFKEHSEALKDSGWEVSLLVNRWVGIRRFLQYGFRAMKGFRVGDEKGLRVVRATYFKLPGSERRNIIRWSAKTARLYARYEERFGKPDLILAHSVTWAGYAAHLIKEKYKVPFVLIEHRSFFVWSTEEARKMVRPFYPPFFEQAYRSCSRAVPVSASLNTGLLELMPWLSEKLEVIPNMIREDLFRPAEKAPEADPFVFIWVGRFEQVKGVDVLLEAVAMLKKETDQNFIVRLAGKGSLQDELEALAVQLGIAGSVEFLGRLSREDIQKEYRRAHCFLTPTRYEAFGVVLIEAMASGLPVIATRSGGPESIVTPECGVLIEKNNAVELKKEMLQMMKTRSGYNSKKIREMTIERYGTESVMNQYGNLFNKLIEE